jgi:C-terminal processing protease CtpA/Prc
LIVICFLLIPCFGEAAPSLSDTLGFEVPWEGGAMGGWSGGPARTIFRDSLTVHAGRFAIRLERTSPSPNDFSNVGRSLPVTFAGDSLELRGWLRTADVRGSAGLWLREDGGSGSVEFDNMQDRGITGTTPWTEYRVSLPLNRKAKRVVFGALLVGPGTAHVDDLQLLVDGRNPSLAPALVREPTAVETDHEFDGGSRVSLAELSAAQIDNLVLLAKVWGFLKYHHPRVMAAKIHWDYELFRLLPPVARAKDRSGANQVLADWLARIGDPEAPEKAAALPDSAQSLPRIDWIKDKSRLGGDLSDRLQRVYARRGSNDDPYFATLNAGVKNPDFSNEVTYPNPTLPDAGFRLLALFRFWNIVEYWSPNRDLVRGDWDGVLREFIPRLMAVRTQDEYRLAMIELVARMNDGHTNLWGSLDARPPRGGCRLPVALRSVEGKFVVGAYADSVKGPASGLKIGDVIQKLDGAPVDSMVAAWAPYYGASNETARRRDVARNLTQGDCGPCLMNGLRAGKPFTLRATRDSSRTMDVRAGLTHDLPGAAFRLLDRDVAYLKLSSFEAAKAAEYVRSAAGTKCFVIDIRNYPSEFAVFALGQHLVDRPSEFTRFTVGDLSNPGAFSWTEPLSIEPAEPRYAGRVVILVDETSQSSAEYTAMALRVAPNALVVGSTTAGADGNVSPFPLPGGLRTMISGIGVFYPDKRPTQRVGIIPDLVVRPTIEGIRAGRDEVLEAALKKVLGRTIVVHR